MSAAGNTLSLEDLKNQELFKSVDFNSILPLLKRCPIRDLKEDESLIRSGDVNQSLYLILSGRFRVHLPADNLNPVTVLEEGQCIGEISIIDHQPAIANVVADCDAHVLVVNESTLWNLIENSHPIACNLLITLAQRLRYGNSLINKINDLLKEHKHNATVDSLTSLYNRRWLDNMLIRVMQRADTNNEPLSVIMIDIDFFKQYNDQNGHVAGDIALRSVSQAILQNLRPEDMVTRYGGEELFALLPGLEIDEAMSISERLRQAVSETEITQVDGDKLPSVTISIGVAQMKQNQTTEGLISAADKALYKAKDAGRNKVFK